MRRDQATKILGLEFTFTDSALAAAYRRAASKNHPDRGGSVDAMQQINAAKACLSGARTTTICRPAWGTINDQVLEMVKASFNLAAWFAATSCKPWYTWAD